MFHILELVLGLLFSFNLMAYNSISTESMAMEMPTKNIKEMRLICDLNIDYTKSNGEHFNKKQNYQFDLSTDDLNSWNIINYSDDFITANYSVGIYQKKLLSYSMEQASKVSSLYNYYLLSNGEYLILENQGELDFVNTNSNTQFDFLSFSSETKRAYTLKNMVYNEDQEATTSLVCELLSMPTF